MWEVFFPEKDLSDIKAQLRTDAYQKILNENRQNKRSRKKVNDRESETTRKPQLRDIKKKKTLKKKIEMRKKNTDMTEKKPKWNQVR